MKFGCRKTIPGLVSLVIICLRLFTPAVGVDPLDFGVVEDAVRAIFNSPIPTYDLQDDEEFDYVVVGAGAGGAAAAARLALQGPSVLLLEAGGQPSLLTYVPGAAMALLGSDVDWKYRTLSNNVSCLSSEDRQCRFSRGLALGGSTNINYMMYVRGNRRDYELGIPGWTWKDLEPYFLRYEALRDLDRLPKSSVPYHNTTGTMNIGFCSDPKNPWHSRIVDGLQSLGVPHNKDVNAASQIGVSRIMTYTSGGVRESTARGYLYRDDVIKALRVSINTHVTGVLIDDANVARGVTADIRGRRVTVRATKAVILSAGTIGTPQILQLSGVGPAEHLNKLGIPVRADLPVGDNLSDHVLPFVFIKVPAFLLETTGYAPQALQYGLARNGPLASIGLTDITAFINTRCYDPVKKRLKTGEDCELPTLQLINAYIPRGAITIGGLVIKQATLLNDNIIAQLAALSAGSGLLLTLPVVLQPESRGHVRLASADPLAPPAILPNYLGDSRDVTEMLRSIKIVEDLVETDVYRSHGASIVHLSIPGCPDYGGNRTEYWSCYVRHMTFSVYHAAGTVPLGPVLTERLGVRGVDRLKVADLSVLPKVPRGNTAAFAIAVGERVADFLEEERKQGV